jgi:hypothetical protein
MQRSLDTIHRDRAVLTGVVVIMILSMITGLTIVGQRASAANPAPTWSQQAPATSPQAREDSDMAYDAASDQFILFGGDTDKGEVGEIVKTCG